MEVDATDSTLAQEEIQTRWLYEFDCVPVGRIRRFSVCDIDPTDRLQC